MRPAVDPLPHSRASAESVLASRAHREISVVTPMETSWSAGGKENPHLTSPSKPPRPSQLAVSPLSPSVINAHTFTGVTDGDDDHHVSPKQVWWMSAASNGLGLRFGSGCVMLSLGTSKRAPSSQ
jgi:hypothetical protein